MTTPDHLPDPDMRQHRPHSRVSPPKRSPIWLESRNDELERENAELKIEIHRLRNELTACYLDPMGQVRRHDVLKVKGS